MQCPNCSSETWNNTEKVAGGWKGPVFKCKDQACGWVKWPDKPKKAGAPQPSGAPRGVPKWTWKQLQETYYSALKIAAAAVPLQVKNATSADIISATAAIFIAASRDGVRAEQPLTEKPKQLEREPGDALPWEE